MEWKQPCLLRQQTAAGDLAVRLGVPVLDGYLEFLSVRARPNTVLAAAYDLKVFFCLVGKPPHEVTPADVFGFITAQYTGGPASRLQSVPGGAAGVSARTVRRRLSSVSGLFAFLVARGDARTNPVPRGLPSRRERQRPRQGVPLVRTPRTLPRILEPAQVNALVAALRSYRDRAMVEAMVLGGLRRCEVLGLRLDDLQVATRRVFITAGKGGHQRLVPVSGRFFTSVASYLDSERLADAGTDRLFVVLKGQRRGQPLTAAGLDQILDSARDRAGLARATCHQLRHTCLTRLREAGMALEAVQAQAGHASIETTRIYLHLADDWLASQYRRAAEAIDAQMLPGRTPGPAPLSIVDGHR
jgi:site-specific recombinase XerD